MYPDAMNLKQQQTTAADAYQNEQAKCPQAPRDSYAETAPSTLGSRPYSLRDEAAKQAQYHQEQAVKSEKAAIFFSKHPQFEEFIRLIRSGAIQF